MSESQTIVVKPQPDAPRGWHMAGSERIAYIADVDSDVSRSGRASGLLKSNRRKINGFGTLMQNLSPVRYVGKRVRLSCYLRSSGISGWAGLWIRVDGAGSGRPLAFDNMQDRPIRGTADWTECVVVVDVHRQASNIAFGVLLEGTGSVWIDEMKFEVVDRAVPLTGTWVLPEEPQNLSFDL